MNTHIMKPANVQTAKNQAKRLRVDLEQSGTQITHSRALELLAHQHGYKDWNTFQAALGNGSNPLQIGQMVRGQYLGQSFEGTLIGLQILAGSRFRVTLDLTEPVDVVRFDSFSSFRKRINATVDTDGKSFEKTSDGQPQLVLEA